MPPRCKITLSSEVIIREKFRFEAFGFHHSDADGSLDTAVDPSSGGTYSGLDPMGFIWSLKPAGGQKVGLRFAPDVFVPSEFRLAAYRGHTEAFEADARLTETRLRRHWISPTVRATPVRHGRVRGLLFAPKDATRRLPGVIDVFGTGGGLMAHRAALLADKCFVTLALPIVGFDDLPKNRGGIFRRGHRFPAAVGLCTARWPRSGRSVERRRPDDRNGYPHTSPDGSRFHQWFLSSPTRQALLEGRGRHL